MCIAYIKYFYYTHVGIYVWHVLICVLQVEVYNIFFFGVSSRKLRKSSQFNKMLFEKENVLLIIYFWWHTLLEIIYLFLVTIHFWWLQFSLLKVGTWFTTSKVNCKIFLNFCVTSFQFTFLPSTIHFSHLHMIRPYVCNLYACCSLVGRCMN